MRFLRSTLLAGAALVAGFGLSACGGGGGGGGTPVGTAALRGTVVSVDGSSSQLAGVTLTDPRTGKTAVSGPNGAFDFGNVPAGTITLRLASTAATVSTSSDTTDTETGGEAGTGDGSGDAAGAPEGDHETGDDDGTAEAGDDGDANDTGDDDFDVTNVSDGENVTVDVTVRDGKIESVEVSCSRGDDRRAQVELTPGAETDDADATGSARIAQNDERSSIRVDAEHLTAGRTVEWFVLDLGGNPESEGTRTVDAEGEAEWKMSTRDGGTLPFGVGSVADLEGFQVEVRDATDGTVLLFGTIPALPVSAPSEDGGHDGSDDGTRARGIALLAASGDGEAHVAVESRTGEEARESIEFEVEGLAAGTALEVWLENPATPGTLEKIGDLTIGSEGEGDLELDTHDGAALPFGATDVAALAGLAVEIRAGDGTVLFSGNVPAAVAGSD